MNKPKLNSFRTLVILALGVCAFCVAGCEHDVDPHAKVDAPGYYNGPMNKKGSSGAALGGESKGDATTK